MKPPPVINPYTGEVSIRAIMDAINRGWRRLPYGAGETITPSAPNPQIEQLKRREAELQEILERTRNVERLENILLLGDGECVSRVRRVRDTVCHALGVSPSAVASETRLAEVVTARHTIWYLLADGECGLSPAQIGTFFNHERGAVIHGIQAIRNRMETVRGFREKVEKLQKQCQQKPRP